VVECLPIHKVLSSTPRAVKKKNLYLEVRCYYNKILKLYGIDFRAGILTGLSKSLRGPKKTIKEVIELLWES
jgi:hypothetical protein